MDINNNKINRDLTNLIVFGTISEMEKYLSDYSLSLDNYETFHDNLMDTQRAIQKGVAVFKSTANNFDSVTRIFSRDANGIIHTTKHVSRSGNFCVISKFSFLHQGKKWYFADISINLQSNRLEFYKEYIEDSDFDNITKTYEENKKYKVIREFCLGLAAKIQSSDIIKSVEVPEEYFEPIIEKDDKNVDFLEKYRDQLSTHLIKNNAGRLIDRSILSFKVIDKLLIDVTIVSRYNEIFVFSLYRIEVLENGKFKLLSYKDKVDGDIGRLAKESMTLNDYTYSYP